MFRRPKKLGRYLIWDRRRKPHRTKRFQIVRVQDEGWRDGWVVEEKGQDYKPFVGAMQCYWLIRLGD